MVADVRFPGPIGITCIGLLQILVWGGSFFLLAVMAAPIMADTGWSSQWVYGALSISLMVSALLAPVSTRLVARYGGRIQLASSGAIVAIGLLIIAGSHSLQVFLVAWVIIGVGMACGLYETLFATLGALYADKAGKAITGITLISGFATTVSWPLVALVIEHFGWRSACEAYAFLLLLVVAPLYLLVLPAGGLAQQKKAPQTSDVKSLDKRTYLLLTSIFALGAIVMTVISVQLVVILQGLGFSLAAAIGLSALLGPSQVGARVLQIVARKRHPIWTALVAAVCVAMGLSLVMASPALAAVGLLCFGCGNGLRAIVRGLLPLAMMPASQYVSMMGRMSRPSLICQAMTPWVSGYLLQYFGASGVLITLVVLALINFVLVLLVLRSLASGTSVR